MPMIDYTCAAEDCGMRFEAFHFPASIPATSPCPSCQKDAPREMDLMIQLTNRPTNALRFEPIAIDRVWECGEWKYSYPGANTDPVTPGYERIYLDTISASDRHIREVGGKEQELRTMQILAEKSVWDQRVKERREDTRALISRKGFSGRYFDAVCRMVDRSREKRYKQLLSREVNFHNQAFSYDGSNRMPHTDITTGWKDRR